jgi:hypothetical protein
LVVGLIAYAAVAAFYAAFDLLAARGALYTLDLLGKVVFRGLRDPTVLQLPLQYDLGAMAWYNGLHLEISLAIGFIVTGLVAHAERQPARAHLVGLIIIMGFVVTILGVGLLTSPVRSVLPWWSVVAANALSVLLAGWYLVQQHPGLWRRLLPFSA